jgi:hypothetical protein
MKWLLGVGMLLCAVSLHSQSSLNFCGGVDPTGICIYNNNKFFFAPDSTEQRVFMEVRDVNTFSGTSKISFKFYSIAKGGEETYLSTTDQDVKSDWMLAWVPHIFTAPGKYNVKVFDDKGEMICDKSLEFFNGK